MSSVSANNKKAISLLLVSTLAVGGCVTDMPDPQKNATISQPKSRPTRSVTSFSDALRCMDRLLIEHNKSGLVITSTAIPDSTGKVAVGLRDMLISSISEMSRTSKAFKYVDWVADEGDTVSNITKQLYSTGDLDIEVPQVYIRGSISQMDDNVQTGSQSAGLTTGVIDLGGGRDRSSGSVTLELHLGDLKTRTILPGADSVNTLSFSKDSKAVNAGASGKMIVNIGLNFDFSLDTAESVGQASRTLMQLAAIELMGKWTQVPYWTCLQVDNTNPGVMGQLQDWYDIMTEKDRIDLFQAGLQGAGYYKGPVNGTFNEELRAAIGKYQADKGLVVNGDISFDVYRSLMAGQVNMKSLPKAPPKIKVSKAAESPIDVTIATNRPPSQPYRVGDSLELHVSLSRMGFPYCYYRDGSGTIAQIYPNRFQPDRQISAGAALTIPDKTNAESFKLEFDKKGVEEEVMCLATDVDVGTMLPAHLKVSQDLVPLKVKSLEQVQTDIQNAVAKSNAKVGAKRVKVKVE